MIKPWLFNTADTTVRQKVVRISPTLTENSLIRKTLNVSNLPASEGDSSRPIALIVVEAFTTAAM